MAVVVAVVVTLARMSYEGSDHFWLSFCHCLACNNVSFRSSRSLIRSNVSCFIPACSCHLSPRKQEEKRREKRKEEDWEGEKKRGDAA